MNLLTSISLGGITLGSAAGIAYGSYKLFNDNSKSIHELLRKNNKTLLTDETSDKEKWNSNWTTYVTDNISSSLSNKKDIWELSDWDQKKSINNVAPESFKNKCKELSTKKVLNDKEINYQKVEKYCSK